MQENPWYYRNKVQMPLGYDKNGQLVTGFYKQKTNDIIACNECLIQNEESNAVIQRVKELFVEYNIKPYDKVTHRGNIKHILTKKGYHSEEFMLCFITYQKTIKHIDQIVEILIQEFPHIKTIIQNINDRHDNVILGDEEKILYGKGYIYDTLLDNQYKISLKSFYQINPIQVEKLYQTAIDLAHINQDSVVLDAYCGIGTITLSLAKHVKKIYGVEVVPQAIEDAKNNALLNKIDNAEFVCDDAGKYMVELVKKNIHLDVVFVDPPRKGCSEEFLEHLLQANPKEIIYISCDVATQARDAKYLNEHGYTITHCQPVDMFPHTFHVETVVLLSHKKPDGHINVKVEFGEGEGKVPLDNIAKRAEEYKPKERVTYKMIKEYIEAKYSFKVHTAYIAEVKRDLDLPMYDAPNAVEELKQLRKHPTAEKVEAIKDALRYFEIMEEI